VKILHLSDTTLSGSPYRISKLITKYTEHESRHITWQPVMGHRVFPCDMVGMFMKPDEIQSWIDWADVIHYHNRWKRQEIFKRCSFKSKPSVIQIHSPRMSEDFTQEIESGVPIAVIAQYHPREWEGLMRYLIPNVVDIHDEIHCERTRPDFEHPVVGYAPSNWNAKGWDNKGFGIVNTFLKKRQLFERDIKYKLIAKRPFLEAMKMKKECDLGIDEFMTGSYHLSSLEFLSMGIATVAFLDELTKEAIMDVTGATTLPWIEVTRHNFHSRLNPLLKDRDTLLEMGEISRKWMEKYWNPQALCYHYIQMYEDILEGKKKSSILQL
jgi:hypothetical protein